MSIVELVERREKVKTYQARPVSKAAAKKDKKALTAGESSAEASQKSKSKWFQRLGRNPKNWD